MRDYIHVVDLGKAHEVALQRVLDKKNETALQIFNLGRGKGSSVLEVITAFEKMSEQKLPYTIVPRRKGDVTEAYAITEKGNTVLGWKTEATLEEAIERILKWEQKSRK